MSEIQAELPPLEERPLVTFALFAYNQEKYIREAIEGAFAQTYEPLEIILSDDCSTDRTFEIMEEMVRLYHGAHKIILNKNIRNKKTTEHVNKVFELSSGELVVMAAGDDVSKPERVRKLVALWINSGKPVCALHSNAVTIGNIENSRVISGRAKRRDYSLTDFVDDLLNTPIHGATAAYAKQLYEDFGPLSKGGLIEDRVFAMRALVSDGLVFCDDVLVGYRVSDSNTSGLKGRADERKWKGWVAANLHSIIDVIDNYLGACTIRDFSFDRRLFAKMLKVLRGWELQNDLVGHGFLKKVRALYAYPQARFAVDKIYFGFVFYGYHNSFLYKLLSSVNRWLK